MGIIVEDCSLEPHSYEIGHQMDPYTVTEYRLKFKIDGKWYLGDEHYKLNEALKMRDKWRKSAGYGQ